MPTSLNVFPPPRCPWCLFHTRLTLMNYWLQQWFPGFGHTVPNECIHLSACSHPLALLISSLNRPAVWAHRTATPRGAQGWAESPCDSRREWGNVNREAATKHLLLFTRHWTAERHLPPQYFSNLIEFIDILLLERCHARCLHWRSLSPWYAPLKTFLHKSNPADRNRCSSWFLGLEQWKCWLHVPACCTAFQLRVVPTFDVEKA